jgi:hypothetical protein
MPTIPKKVPQYFVNLVDLSALFRERRKKRVKYISEEAISGDILEGEYQLLITNREIDELGAILKVSDKELYNI